MLHAVLMPAADGNAAFALPLRSGSYVIGRGSTCDIVILDPSVSRCHARLTVSGSEISIRDLGSQNGTFVDEEAIETCLVRPGHVIRFGAMPYRLVLEKATSLAPQCDDDETGKRRPGDNESDANLLTPAQLRVYELLLEGTPEADIGARLGLSVHTVHTHVKAIYVQLGVHSRGELLARQLKSRRNP
jgi:DNA-binding CsgD family transcriptional regulator